MRVLKEKLLDVRKLPMYHIISINAYDGAYLVAEAIKYAKDHYRGDYFTGEKLRQAILDKKEFSSLSVPGLLDLNTPTVSRPIGS